MVHVRPVPVDVVLPLRHAVLRAGLPLDTARFEGDDAGDTIHLAAMDGDAVVGVATLLARPQPDADPHGPAMQLRGMAVAASHRGTGVGAALVRAMVEQAQQRGVAVIWCNARTHAAGFYESFGFRRLGESFDVPTVGPHYRMSLDL